MKKRAIISVSDKEGIVEFAGALVDLGFEILSTGGTARVLEGGGVEVVRISEMAGFPEVLDGRVKTLHPAVHAPILARGSAAHQAELVDHKMVPVELVCVNLYPFKETIRRPDTSFEEAVEQIDIGGPTMIRAAAKNHERVTILVDRADYELVLKELRAGQVLDKTRRRLAAKAFRHTAAYDARIAHYLTEAAGEEGFPEVLTLSFEREAELRYGENPHQEAAFYRDPLAASGWLPSAKQLQGKALSYNNINDANAALELLREFEGPAAVALKHMNPCGVGRGESLVSAFKRAREADPVSIFGGIIALNRSVDEETARELKEAFLEIVLAPTFEPAALEVLRAKRNLRLLEFDEVDQRGKSGPSTRVVSVEGGLLVQSADEVGVHRDEWEVVTERAPAKAEREALEFAWRVVKHVKSNAIVVADSKMTFGIGAGQMNRVGAARIALEQAGPRARGAVLASDAFFPMKDTVEAAAEAGIAAIIQPGGSIRDDESIAAADKAQIAMIFTKKRHFKH